jgi:hypothetical protein
MIVNNETLDQVSQFTYLGCSISYQFSNDVKFKLAKFLKLIGIIKRTIFSKVRTETILKLYNTLILPTFLYASENWTSNPFKIIPLQSTTKENNSETEETLARAAVTLEMERAKRPNP